LKKTEISQKKQEERQISQPTDLIYESMQIMPGNMMLMPPPNSMNGFGG